MMTPSRPDPATPTDWHLPAGYVARIPPQYFDDAPNLAGDVVYQPDVYAFAEYLAEATGRSTVLDIGCGSARKLLAIAARRRIGVDFEANIRTCRAHTPNGTWIEADLEREPLPPIPGLDPADTIVVNSDVIEHLVDPSNLVAMLAALHDAGAVVLVSTPDRVRSRGAEHMGPPGNLAHVREWALPELKALLAERGLPAAFGGYTLNNTRRWLKSTLLTVHDKAVSEAVHAALAQGGRPPVRDEWKLSTAAHETAMSPWPELDLDRALGVVAALGYDSVQFSQFLMRAAKADGAYLHGHFSRRMVADRPRSSADRTGQAGGKGVFPYRFPSLVGRADFAGEPADVARPLKQEVRRRMAGMLRGPGASHPADTFIVDNIVESISDVAARRAAFLRRLA